MEVYAFKFYIRKGGSLGICHNEILNDMSTSEVSSNIKTNNESWYSSNLESYQDSIEDVVYCNDRSTLGLDANSTFKYKVFDRYLNSDITLACENDKDRYSANTSVGNGKLTYPIGLITYDEAIMAGAKFGSSYLTESINYWTMTPSYIIYLFSIGTNGFESKKNTESIYNRPVISIKTDDLLIVKGDGTGNNPFVLK